MKLAARLAGVAAVTLGLLGMLPPAAHAQPTVPQLELSLLGVSPVTGPKLPLQFSLAVRNAGTAPIRGLTLAAFAGEIVTTRSDFTYLVENPGRPSSSLAPVQRFDALTVQPGTSAVLPAQKLPVPSWFAGGDPFGVVRQLSFRVTGVTADGPVSARVTTFLPYASQPVANPLRLALLVPLHEPTHRDGQGSFADGRLGPTLSTSGPLGAIAAQLAAPGAPRLTLVIDALLVQEASRLAGNSTVRAGGKVGPQPPSVDAQRFLRNLRAAAGRPDDPPAAFPYDNADLPALIRAGLEAEAFNQVTYARRVLEQDLAPRLDRSLAWPAGGTVDAVSLKTLADVEADAVVVDPRVAPPSPSSALTQNATVSLGDGVGRPAHALVPDAGLSAALTDPRAASAPVEWAQRVLAETALVWLEQPGGGTRPAPRGILLAPPQSWRPAPRFFRQLSSGLGQASWLRVEPASQLAAEVPQGPDPVPRPLALSADAGADSELPPDYLAQVDVARQRLKSFLVVLGGDDPPFPDYNENLLIAESSDWRPPARRPRGLSFVHTVNAGIDRLYHEVTVEPQTFLLTARNGTVPIRITNHSDRRLTVVLRLESPKVDLPAGAGAPFTLQPNSGKLSEVRVETRTTGAFPVVVRVLTGDGADQLATGQVVIRSTAVNRIALGLTGGAAGFLLLWWGLGRRRSGRHASGRQRLAAAVTGRAGTATSEAAARGAASRIEPTTSGAAASRAATGRVDGRTLASGAEPADGGAAASRAGAAADRAEAADGTGGLAHRDEELEPAGPAVPAAVADPDEQPAEPSLARSTSIMAAGTLLSRVTGMLRVIVLGAVLGVQGSKVPDVYNIANTTPNIVYELVLGGILTSIFVPLFVEVLRTRGRRDADYVGNAVMTGALVILSLLALVTMATAPWVIQLYTLRITNPVQRAAFQHVGAQLLVMFMPQIVFYGVGAVMTGLLNANRKFGVPMFAPVLNNLTVIAVMLTFNEVAGDRALSLGTLTPGDKLLLGLGTTAGVAAMTLVQVPFLRRIGFRFRFVWDLRDPAIRKMAKLSAYTIGYVVVNQLGYLVIPIIASNDQGGYSAYTYAFIFFQLPHGVFTVSVITALLPQLSEHAVVEDWARFRDTVSRGLRLSAVVLLPASVGYLVLAGPIVQLLLEHGKVTAADTALLTRVLDVFVLGLVAFSTFQLLLRAFYALRDTRTPLLVNIVAVSVNVVADIALYAALPRAWKIAGLAAGHSLSYMVGSTLLLWRLRRRIGSLDGPRIVGTVVRAVAASVVMGVVVALVARATDRLQLPGIADDLAVVAAGVAAGVAIYLAAALILRIRELGLLLSVLNRRRPARV